MNAGQFMALGVLSGLPLNALTAYVHYIYTRLETGASGPSLGSILLTQLAFSLAGLFVAWRFSYLAWIRGVMIVLSVLAIPVTLVGAWLAYVRMVGRFM